MPSWLPAIPYSPARDDGYWAPVTSTLDWCEENYYATHYSAEVVNSFTNLLFLYLGVKGIYNCSTQGHDQIFLIAFVGYLFVGVGSFSFHSTLKYPMQLVDELSMIYTTCLMFWATFEYKRRWPIPLFLGIFVFGLAMFITGYYHYIQDPTFHQSAYAILTALVLGRSIFVMEVNIRPYFRNRQAMRMKGQAHRITSKIIESEELRIDERDADIIKQMWIMVAFGLAIFLGGFGIWAVDNKYCSKLRQWRHELGLPWGILLEGHGWWHLMTGYGAYFYIVWGIWLRHCLNGRQDQYEMKWPNLLTSIPEVVRKERLTEINGANGSLKKAN